MLPSTLGYQRSTWAGNPSNPYDTTRAASLGSSSGSGVSVGANLVMAALGEETRASCRGPSNHNSVALLLPHKALISASTAAPSAPTSTTTARASSAGRSPIRAKVIDALKDPREGYYDARDILHDGPAVERPEPSVCGHRGGHPERRVAEGHAHRHHPRVDGGYTGQSRDRADHHGRRQGDQDGSGEASWARPWSNRRSAVAGRPRHREHDDVDFGALTRLVPVFMPDILFRVGRDGSPSFPTSPRPSSRRSSRQARRSARGRWRPSTIWSRWPRASATTVESQHPNGPAAAGLQGVPLPLRAVRSPVAPPTGRTRGFTETLVDFPTLNARSKFWGDDQRAAFKNWEEIEEIRATR